MRDVCLITVDCWRDDSLSAMSFLDRVSGEWERRTAVTASAATHGAFPALLGGGYELDIYDEDHTVRPDVSTVADVFSEAGYATAGIVASNPFCSRWGKRFDHFENDGLTGDSDSLTHGESALSKVGRLLTFQKRIPATEALASARQWWLDADEPRFLWVHLMEPHEPFYPGFERGFRAGPLRSYLSCVSYAKRRENIPGWMQRKIRTLYDACVQQLDEALAPFLRWLPDETVTVITGDHGEEFDHGVFEHARMYNETVRVPYLTNEPACAPPAACVRQIDIPSAILESVGLSTPEEWEGRRPEYETMPITLSMNTSPQRDRTWIAAQDETRKLIKTYDLDGELLDTERYDLSSDPDETGPVSRLSGDAELVDALDSLWDHERFEAWIGTTSRPGLDGTVDERLDQLGYK